MERLSSDQDLLNDRYERQIILDGIGLSGQKKIQNSRILIVGVGGLGSPCATYLTAAGVGYLTIIDHDRVSLSNLQRQILYTTDQVGKLKSEIARQRLNALNPEVKITSLNEKITENNAHHLINEHDIVIDCTDNYGSRYLLNDCSFFASKPLIHGSIRNFEGAVAIFNDNKEASCLRCLFPTSTEPSQLVPNQGARGVLGVLPGVIGAMQASLALQFILKLTPSFHGKMVRYNALTLKTTEYKLPKDPDCILCKK